nr:MBL fold metallo-hydrolase [Thioalkalivibrio sp. ALJ24]
MKRLQWMMAGCLWLVMAAPLGADVKIDVEIPGPDERLSDARTSDLERVDQLQPVRVAEDVYAIIGSIEGRTYDNLGLTMNLGFVVTDEGVVLIDSGPSYAFGEMLEEAIGEVTDQPVTHVIGIGSQDHRWMADGYFREQGAELITLERTAETRKDFADDHIERMSGILEDRFEGTEAVVTDEPLEGDRHELKIGGTEFHLEFWADAHFPGDAVVYLPQTDVFFSGDMVYLDRMLGIHPWSDPVAWLTAVEKLEEKAPAAVVPGHGDVAGMDLVTAETGDYLRFVVSGVEQAHEDWASLQETVDDLADAPEFEHLEHFGDWHRPNINRTYLFME